MKSIKLTIAALFLAACIVLAGCSGASDNKNNDPTKTAEPGSTEVSVITPKSTPQIADGTGYDNSVVINEGTVEGTTFNWQFFVGKSGAGRLASITIINKNGGKEEELNLSGGVGSFTLRTGKEDITYKYLLSYTADFPEESSFSMVELCVLTDDPTLSAEDFFGGSVPEDARIGDVNENGMVVYTNYKAK